MRDMKALALLLGEIENQVSACMRCGMCQSVCPVFAETGREADVARGKLALLDGLLHQVFQNPDGVDERLTRCLLCGSCASSCPSGVKVLDIFIKARAVITGYRGLHPFKKFIFRNLLAKPALFDKVLEWGVRFQGIFAKPVDDLLGTSCAKILSPLGNRHFKPLASQPFHRAVPFLDTPPGASGIRVGFFPGCLTDKLFPQVAHATLKTLAHHGVGVFIPENLGCCGIPALASGDTETFRKLVRHNLELFEGRELDHIVTVCATCASTIKKLWPTMVGNLPARDQEKMEALAEKTLDISQLLTEKLKIGVREIESEGEEDGEERRNRISVTYHDPCHLKKSLGVFRQPRALIQANPRYLLKEMAEADRCCGCGGSFNLEHYDLSSSIGRRKRDNIVASGCSVAATSCPACMMHMGDMLSQAGDPIVVRHVIELYAEGL